MDYRERITGLIEQINPEIVDLSIERKRGTPPSQVSSEFLTNKEQGDWAEKTLMECINQNSRNCIAVKYGRDDDIIAGEPGFREFYERYQDELDSIGKRPDLLIFDRRDFPYGQTDISHWDNDILDKTVPLAKCGIEVRSSAFLMTEYERCAQERSEALLADIADAKNEILTGYSQLLREKKPELLNIVSSITDNNLDVIAFRTPSWRSSPELTRLSLLLKRLNSSLHEFSKRSYLSITPKIEDLRVVYNWIRAYNVPHFYVQMFFDKAYGISYERILHLLNRPELEGDSYSIEQDVKNQFKTTVKIKASKEANILTRIDLPEHRSELRQLGRGRLLYYVRFEQSAAALDVRAFNKLFGVSL